MSGQINHNVSNTLLPSVEACLNLVRNSSCHLRRTPDVEWLRKIDAIQEHIPRVFAVLDPLQKAEFAVGLWRWYEARAKFQEGSILLLRASANIGDLPFTLKMEASTALGVLNGKIGKHTLSCQHFIIAARTATFLKSPSDQAHIYHFHGQALRQMGDLDGAEEKHKDALSIWAERGDGWGVATAYGGLGVVAWMRGNIDEAQDNYNRSAEGYKACQDCRQSVLMLLNLANVAYERENYLLALKHYKDALSILRDLGDILNVANNLNNVGAVYCKLRQYKLAESFLFESLEISYKIGYNNAVLFALCSLAEVAIDSNDLQRGVLLYSALDVLGKSVVLPFLPDDKAKITKHLDHARQTLGKPRFGIFWNRVQRQQPAAIVERILSRK